MKIAVQPGFYWDPDTRREVEIRSGAVRHDQHADVLRCPSIFRDVDAEQAAPAPAKAEARPAAARAGQSRPAKTGG